MKNKDVFLKTFGILIQKKNFIEKVF